MPAAPANHSHHGTVDVPCACTLDPLIAVFERVGASRLGRRLQRWAPAGRTSSTGPR